MASDSRDQLVSEIESRLDIVDYIGETIELTRKGNRYWGLCPFHGEKTASFSVSRERQLYYCFGCHAGGNLFGFVMRQRSCDFKEALEHLAEKAGIDMTRYASPKNVAKSSKNKSLLQINMEASSFYQKKLRGPEGKAAYNYLVKRGLAEETIDRFRLGYAPNDWRKLQDHLFAGGIDVPLLVESGLIKRSQNNDLYIDTFRNRVIFPIQNIGGSIIGFGGRIMEGDGPKYLNSPETPVFSKRNNLFGLYQGKESIIAGNEALLVEGYMDCIQLHQHGVTNAVASLGTAFTHEQAKLIKRLAQNLTIIYDGDEAGQRETFKAMAVLQDEGISPYVVTLPLSMDPDEYVKQHGKEEFLDFVKNNRVTSIEFKLENYLKSDFSASQEGKTKILWNLFLDVERVPSLVLRNQFMSLLARRLQLTERDVTREYNAWVRSKGTDGISRNRNFNIRNNRNHVGKEKKSDLEERILGKMLEDNDVFENIKQEIGLSFFADPHLAEIAAAFDELNHAFDRRETLYHLQESLQDNETMVNLVARVCMLDEERPVSGQEVDDFIKMQKISKEKEKWARFNEKLSELEMGGDFYSALRHIVKLGEMTQSGQEGGKK